MTIEKRNIIIALVAVAVIGGGIYYNKSKDNKEDAPVAVVGSVAGDVQEENNQLPVLLGNDTSDKTTSVPAKSSNNPGTTSQTLNLKAQFDAVMANASKAFGGGNYTLALKYYNDALLIKNADVAYSGMFNVYTAQENWVKAEWAINKALDLNSTYTEYWNWKLTLLDERTNASFTQLKQIYENGLNKGDSRTKVNLVTHFAVIAEGNGEKSEAITLWEYAKTLNPPKTAIYQAEIDRLRAS